MNRTLLNALAGMKPMERMDILIWAEAPDGGGLPEPSAEAFADWLDENFYGFNEDGDKTNEQVLKGARSYWVGGTQS